MKQKDIALVVVIGVVSLVLALVLSNVFLSSSSHSLSAEQVPVITSSFDSPDSKYFNSQSVDPTQTIQIGNSDNQTPFNADTSQ